ncbi:hypothetical protein DE146DRAFT_631571 [Phaeosphaeria sp. MPI-PUGE-AT-0046c]|nr:hypothetical protein DE146DRAFT_631571 [Phaeosphaeria sp. MPI-PUGE-AT-0046c]
MSTHFRPRPPSAPTFPVRPSTAHSTIRAVTPSPPHDLPRPKSAHAIASPDFTAFAHYVLHADNSRVFNNTPPTTGCRSGMLHRSGARTSRSLSPEKSKVRVKTRSPKKARPMSSASVLQTRDEGKEKGAIAEEDDSASTDSEDFVCPDTPTPITLEQKRRAYIPLGSKRPTPRPVSLPPPLFSTNTPPTSPSCAAPPIPHKSPRRPPSARLSISATSHITTASAASAHSIFSTPGRDELERKKALVEADDGPFGRAISVADLAAERRRVSGGTSKRKDGRREGEGGHGEREKKRRGCMDCGGVGCVVM